MWRIVALGNALQVTYYLQVGQWLSPPIWRRSL
jgi:hypothetical protein